EPDRLQLGKSLAAAGAAEEDRELGAYQLAATAGKDGRQAGHARLVLLAHAGREPLDVARAIPTLASDGRKTRVSATPACSRLQQSPRICAVSAGFWPRHRLGRR